MKSFFVFVLLCCTISASAQIQSVTIQASGLTCSMCSRAIFKALQKVSNVSKVQEDIEHSSYKVQFADQEKVSPSDLRKAVTDAGFSVARMEILANLQNAVADSDSSVRLADLNFTFSRKKTAPLSGIQKLLILNKGYLPEPERKKYEKAGGKPSAMPADKQYLVTILNS